MTNYLVFGDSITQGVYFEKGLSWADKLKRDIHSKKIRGNLVFNLGIGGDTVEGVLNRLDNEINPRLGNDNILIFAVGINDSAINKDFNLIEKDFVCNIEKLIEKASRYTKKIVFIGLTNVDEVTISRFFGNNQLKKFTNKRIEKIDNILESICDEKKLGYIKMFDLLDNNDFTDGLHPGGKGQEKMYIRIKECLDEFS